MYLDKDFIMEVGKSFQFYADYNDVFHDQELECTHLWS